MNSTMVTFTKAYRLYVISISSHQPKNRSTAQWAEELFYSNKRHKATPSAQGVQKKDSLSLLEGSDLTLDLVVLPRHLAVLLVHQDALLQSHTGRHRLWGKIRKTVREAPDVQRKKNEKYNGIFKFMLISIAFLFI